ncbi:MAG: polyprenyl synthetase family protein [Pseudomonadales bacterium]|nr:polyprenyl synthetase family protein [Pseudomonadales bacterium]MCP5170811.1 polyprenyl synthetase family protein [Pseudomonadales bacterium]MCP5301949.1 polyprenyl synthetase family protein [Pseudomonadales bacterium]
MGHAEFLTFSSQSQQRANRSLEHCLQDIHSAHERLAAAMRYSVLSGGKRIRPMLVYASAFAVGEINSDSDLVANAVELIHAYSLIHDDLPAMDDDALRRGQPTCHIAFDEATAILAGDALQSLAFEQLTLLQHTSPQISLNLVRTLAEASGSRGMVAGQSIDINAAHQTLDLSQLSNMHSLKTGAMIVASILMGALTTGTASAQQLTNLRHYAETIGLAFQVQDDILDVISSTEVLGKTQGADQSLNKPTFVSLLGLDQAKLKLEQLYQQSLTALESFDQRANHLRDIAHYIVHRDH